MRGLAFMDVIFAAPLAREGLVRDVMPANEDVIAEMDFSGGGGRRDGNSHYRGGDELSHIRCAPFCVDAVICAQNPKPDDHCFPPSERASVLDKNCGASIFLPLAANARSIGM